MKICKTNKDFNIKTLKLTGNFDYGYALVDAYEKMQLAKQEVDEIVNRGEHGSQEYFDALKAFKSAQADHEKIVKMDEVATQRPAR